MQEYISHLPTDHSGERTYVPLVAMNSGLVGIDQRLNDCQKNALQNFPFVRTMRNGPPLGYSLSQVLLPLKEAKERLDQFLKHRPALQEALAEVKEIQSEVHNRRAPHRAPAMTKPKPPRLDVAVQVMSDFQVFDRTGLAHAESLAILEQYDPEVDAAGEPQPKPLHVVAQELVCLKQSLTNSVAKGRQLIVRLVIHTTQYMLQLYLDYLHAESIGVKTTKAVEIEGERSIDVQSASITPRTHLCDRVDVALDAIVIARREAPESRIRAGPAHTHYEVQNTLTKRAVNQRLAREAQKSE
ncbi:MAG: uncharacterized protein KVP18_003030 [Porospora cf. gigantea A]|uniref:uncharacterized protein n=1 Tax=Porospora cf. gigantea A TaxID=2853593 RepID=UPI00355A0EC2|nr:MAG: hypothetical protein KVP18_003030 [Porospora cf. gigantea A]